MSFHVIVDLGFRLIRKLSSRAVHLNNYVVHHFLTWECTYSLPSRILQCDVFNCSWYKSWKHVIYLVFFIPITLILTCMYATWGSTKPHIVQGRKQCKNMITCRNTSYYI